MDIDAGLVTRVAHLARLGLDDQERESAAGELAALLEHFRTLQDVDTQGVEPLVHALDTPGHRQVDQVAGQPEARARLLALTEHAREGFLVVPRVLEADFSPEAGA